MHVHQEDGTIIDKTLIYTDLDGTFLDAVTYSCASSRPILERALQQGLSVVFCSSKTGVEIAQLCGMLGITQPFIAENGGGLFIPEGFFRTPLDDLPREGNWRIMTLGTPYPLLVDALRDVRHELKLKLVGFSDMSLEEVARSCGFSLDRARPALQRRFDEPFLAEGLSEDSIERMRGAFAGRGLQITRGGRFFHVIGANDKGTAVRRLNDLFLREADSVDTVGLGDSANDLPLLRVVGQPFLVQKPDGTYDSHVLDQLPGVVRVPGVGPAGWAMAVEEVLRCRHHTEEPFR